VSGKVTIKGDLFEILATWKGGLYPGNPSWSFRVVQGGEYAKRVVELIESDLARKIPMVTSQGYETLPPKSWPAFIAGLSNTTVRRDTGYELVGAKAPGLLRPTRFDIVKTQKVRR
jgi:hypothetical protein